MLVLLTRFPPFLPTASGTSGHVKKEYWVFWRFAGLHSLKISPVDHYFLLPIPRGNVHESLFGCPFAFFFSRIESFLVADFLALPSFLPRKKGFMPRGLTTLPPLLPPHGLLPVNSPRRLPETSFSKTVPLSFAPNLSGSPQIWRINFFRTFSPHLGVSPLKIRKGTPLLTPSSGSRPAPCDVQLPRGRCSGLFSRHIAF